MRIAILGAGAWGTALACALAGRREVTLWARSAHTVVCSCPTSQTSVGAGSFQIARTASPDQTGAGA